MDGFDVALVGVGAGRDELMLGAEGGDGGGKMRTGAIGFELAVAAKLAPQLFVRAKSPPFAPLRLTFERFLQSLRGMTDRSYGRGQGDGSFTY